MTCGVPFEIEGKRLADFLLIEGRLIFGDNSERAGKSLQKCKSILIAAARFRYSRAETKLQPEVCNSPSHPTLSWYFSSPPKNKTGRKLNNCPKNRITSLNLNYHP